MTHILDYIVSVNICLLVFFVFYYLFLAREKFFKVNRFFLLFAVLLSFVIPSIDIEIPKDEILETQIISKPVLLAEKFIPKGALEEKITKPSIIHSVQAKEITVTVQSEEIANQNTANTQVTATILPTQKALSQVGKTANSSWDIELWQVLLGSYIFGVILLSIRTLRDIFFLLRTGFNSKSSTQKGYRLINTEGRLPTLSFFRLLFWDNSIELNKKQEEQIIKHELAHIKQWHTIDVLLIELLCILFWYNPIVYLFRKAIKEVHEYLADAAVLESTCPNTYAKLLLGQILGSPQLLLSNHFMQAQVKKRITMMTQKNSNRSTLWKYLLVIPILVGMVISFARLSEVPSEDSRIMRASLLSGELNSLENSFLFFNKPSELEKIKKEEELKEKEVLATLEKEKLEVKQEKRLGLENVTLSNQEAMLIYAQNNVHIQHLMNSQSNSNFEVFYDSSDRKKEKRTIVWVKKGKEYKLDFDGDEIEKLEIDGKLIPKEDYDKHINIIDKAKSNHFVFIGDKDDEDGQITIDINIDEDFGNLGELKKLGKMKVISFDCDDDGNQSKSNSHFIIDEENGVAGFKMKVRTKDGKKVFIIKDGDAWEEFGERMEKWGEEFAANFENGFDFTWVEEDGKKAKKHKKHKYKTRTVRVDDKTSQNKIKFKVITEDMETQKEEFQKQREELQEQREELQKQREELQKQRTEPQKQREELQKQREELQKQREELQKQREELKKQKEELKKENKN